MLNIVEDTKKVHWHIGIQIRIVWDRHPNNHHNTRYDVQNIQRYRKPRTLQNEIIYYNITLAIPTTHDDDNAYVCNITPWLTPYST